MKIEALTPLRFIAAAVVVIFHFGLRGTEYRGFFSAGPQMVSFFFVLSGFVLAFAYYEKMPRLNAYFISRAARILPVYFLALVTLWLYYLLTDISPNPIGIALNLTLTQAWYPPLALSMNSPGWSLSIEAFFYLVFPVLLTLFTRSGWGNGPLFFSALVFWLLTQLVLSSTMEADFFKELAPTPSLFVHYFPLSHLCSFVLGLSGGVWYRRTSPSIENHWLSTLFIVLAASLLVFVLENQRMVYRAVGYKLAFKSSFLSPLYLLLIVAVASSRGVIVTALSWRPLVFLGEISYSVYILQFPAFLIYYSLMPESFRTESLAYFLGYFALLLLASAVCYRYFELPLNRYFRQFRAG